MISHVSSSSLIPVEYTLPDVQPNSPRVTLLGLYPTKSSSPATQHANATSRHMISVLGTTTFDWVDLFPFAPTISSADIYLNKLRLLLLDPSTPTNTRVDIALN